eukprot:365840-Chlamydomonas_euryale.AAC.6
MKRRQHVLTDQATARTSAPARASEPAPATDPASALDPALASALAPAPASALGPASAPDPASSPDSALASDPASACPQPCWCGAWWWCGFAELQQRLAEPLHSGRPPVPLRLARPNLHLQETRGSAESGWRLPGSCRLVEYACRRLGFLHLAQHARRLLAMQGSAESDQHLPGSDRLHARRLLATQDSAESAQHLPGSDCLVEHARRRLDFLHLAQHARRLLANHGSAEGDRHLPGSSRLFEHAHCFLALQHSVQLAPNSAAQRPSACLARRPLCRRLMPGPRCAAAARPAQGQKPSSSLRACRRHASRVRGTQQVEGWLWLRRRCARRRYRHLLESAAGAAAAQTWAAARRCGLWRLPCGRGGLPRLPRGRCVPPRLLRGRGGLRRLPCGRCVAVSSSEQPSQSELALDPVVCHTTTCGQCEAPAPHNRTRTADGRRPCRQRSRYCVHGHAANRQPMRPRCLRLLRQPPQHGRRLHRQRSGCRQAAPACARAQPVWPGTPQPRGRHLAPGRRASPASVARHARERAGVLGGKTGLRRNGRAPTQATPPSPHTHPTHTYTGVLLPALPSKYRHRPTNSRNSASWYMTMHVHGRAGRTRRACGAIAPPPPAPGTRAAYAAPLAVAAAGHA